MWRCVIEWVIPDVSKVPVDHSTLEDESDTFLRNVFNKLPSGTAALPKDRDSHFSVFVKEKVYRLKKVRVFFRNTKKWAALSSIWTLTFQTLEPRYSQSFHSKVAESKQYASIGKQIGGRRCSSPYNGVRAQRRITGITLLFICVYITNYLHFFNLETLKTITLFKTNF